MPVKVESTPMLPGLSPVGGKAIVRVLMRRACRLMALREVEQRLASPRLAPGGLHP